MLIGPRLSCALSNGAVVTTEYHMGDFAEPIVRVRETLRAWLSVADYDVAKEANIRTIFGRFSRGNTLVQRGDYMTEGESVVVRQRGDKAMAQLSRAVSGK